MWDAFGWAPNLLRREREEWPFVCSGGEDLHLTCDAAQDFEGLIDLLARVLAGHDGADAGFALGNGGKGDAASHKSGVEEGSAEIHCLAAVADDDGRDRGFALGSGFPAYVETGVGELFLEVGGVGPEALDAFGLGLEEIKGGDASGGD